MAVNREWRCVAHDYEFESMEEKPRCPHGCSPKFVVMEFRTPHSIRHGGTHTMDVMQKKLAADYGLSDMRNDKDGTSVMQSTRVGSGGVKRSYTPEKLARFSPAIFSPPQGWAQRGEAPPVYNHTMKGTQTNIPKVLQGAPSLRSKTIFQKPK